MKKSRLLGAVCAILISSVSLSARAVGTWETTLLARDYDANPATIEGWYDTVLDVTWLANANANGQMTWDAASAWAASLDIDGVAGPDGWRLPTMIDTGTAGCNYAYTGTDCGYNVQTTSGSPPYPATTVYSEMASLFYDTLGNLAYYDTSAGVQTGWGLSNTGPFNALQGDVYWSGLEYAPNTSSAWVFNFYYGNQDPRDKTNSYFALAVHDGDFVAAPVPAPVPAAVWLFGSGLLGLIGVARRKVRV